MKRHLRSLAAMSLLLPLGLLDSSSAGPGAASSPSSGPAGLPLAIDARSGRLLIGRPPAPVLPELFLYDGQKTSPAPPQVIAGEGLRLQGFSGKYPVPVGVGLSGPAAKRMWGIYADTSLDASGIDRAKMKGLVMWLVVSSKGEAIAMIGVSLAEESRFYISPGYVVFAQASLKVAPNGPFATFLFPAALRDLSVSRNGAKVESGMLEEAQGVALRFEKAARNDLIEWEVTGAKAAKGSIRPLLLGAEAGFVEYIVAIPGDGAASRPVTK